MLEMLPNHKDLTTKVVKVRLPSNKWAGRKFDSVASHQLNESKKANHDASRVNKKLILGDPKSWTALNTAHSQIVAYYYANSLPWDSGKGFRVISVHSWMKFRRDMNELMAKYNEAIDDFLHEYPSIIKNIESKKLAGELFKPSDYPSVDTLKNRFRISLDFEPLTLDTPDFRIVQISDEDIAELEASMQRKATEGLKRTTLECWKRLYKVVKKMAEKLSEPIEEYITEKGQHRKTGGFKDSLITNISDLLDMMPEFNIADDQDLKDMCQTIKRNLIADPADIKNDAEVREVFASTAHKIANRISTHLEEDEDDDEE